MPRDSRHGDAWYSQPVAWLGIAVFLASIAGCIWLVVVAGAYDDEGVPIDNHRIFGVPTQHAAPPR